MSLASFTAASICTFTQILTGVQARWLGCGPETKQRVYFANHSSHGDFVLIWASLPFWLRQQTRPVAALDYWLGTPLRRYLIQQVFKGVLIQRQASAKRDNNPITVMGEALQQGQSLIIFPEGTRHREVELLPFKSGIYHLAHNYPDVEFVPVWINNLGRVLPKGAWLPVPLLCDVTFGAPMQLLPNETKADFLKRTQQALSQLAPEGQ